MIIENLITDPSAAISVVLPQLGHGGMQQQPGTVRQNFAEFLQTPRLEVSAGSELQATKQEQVLSAAKSISSNEQAVFADASAQPAQEHRKLIEVLPRDVTSRLMRESNGRENGKGFIESVASSAATGWSEVETAIGSADNLSALQLLELQVKLYRVAHKIEIFSKVADQTSSGLKSVLNTNI